MDEEKTNETPADLAEEDVFHVFGLIVGMIRAEQSQIFLEPKNPEEEKRLMHKVLDDRGDGNLEIKRKPARDWYRQWRDDPRTKKAEAIYRKVAKEKGGY